MPNGGVNTRKKITSSTSRLRSEKASRAKKEFVSPTRIDNLYEHQSEGYLSTIVIPRIKPESKENSWASWCRETFPPPLALLPLSPDPRAIIVTPFLRSSIKYARSYMCIVYNPVSISISTLETRSILGRVDEETSTGWRIGEKRDSLDELLSLDDIR